MNLAAHQDLIGAASLALLLGVRHGLDADHLAAIDGLTRANAGRRPRLARNAGLLFSLGHGAVVLSVALTASALASTAQLPGWLQAFGAWFSITVLVVLALVNLVVVFRADSQAVPTLFGWRANLLSRWFSAASVPMVLMVGGLFALSFDTLGQATLFAVVSARYGGTGAAALLAACFVAGMLAVDGANGIWISRLIHRSDRTARVASRLMGLTVAGVGLLSAALGVGLQTSPALAAWCQGRELWFGLAVIAVVLVSYRMAMRLAAEPSAGVAHDPSLGVGG